MSAYVRRTRNLDHSHACDDQICVCVAHARRTRSVRAAYATYAQHTRGECAAHVWLTRLSRDYRGAAAYGPGSPRTCARSRAFVMQPGFHDENAAYAKHTHQLDTSLNRLDACHLPTYTTYITRSRFVFHDDSASHSAHRGGIAAYVKRTATSLEKTMLAVPEIDST